MEARRRPEGTAGETLLSTYDAERRPAAAFTVEQAYSRYVTRSAPYLRSENMQAIENDLNIELGYCYHSAAVIPDPDEKRVPHDNPRETRGRPGTRAPHILLERNGEKISSLDLFGGNFVLLAGPEGRAWKESAHDAAKQLELSLDVYLIGDDGVTDPSGTFADAYGIGRGGAAIVRPDGFVAWRAKTAQAPRPPRSAPRLQRFCAGRHIENGRSNRMRSGPGMKRRIASAKQPRDTASFANKFLAHAARFLARVRPALRASCRKPVVPLV